MEKKLGYSVKITRADGSSFLAFGQGIFPAVWAKKRLATEFKKRLSEHMDPKRLTVVRVEYSLPMEVNP